VARVAERFRPGEITAAQARMLNELLELANQFKRLTAAPPLFVSRRAGIPVLTIGASTIIDDAVAASAAASAATPCTGCGWVGALRDADCLFATITLTGSCAGAPPYVYGGYTYGGGSSPPPPVGPLPPPLGFPPPSPASPPLPVFYLADACPSTGGFGATSGVMSLVSSSGTCPATFQFPTSIVGREDPSPPAPLTASQTRTMDGYFDPVGPATDLTIYADPSGAIRIAYVTGGVTYTATAVATCNSPSGATLDWFMSIAGCSAHFRVELTL
jgi:hypothetical protein